MDKEFGDPINRAVAAQTRSHFMRGHRLPAVGTLLMALVLGCMIPGTIGTLFLFVNDIQDERKQLEQSSIHTARALGLVLDQKFSQLETTALLLSQDQTLRDNKLALFHNNAISALARVQIAGHVVLSDASGQVVLNTLADFGAALPLYGNQAQLRQVFSTGQSVISDVFVGGFRKKHAITIAVPVFNGGKIVYVLSLSFDPERINELLRRQNFPKDWIAFALDSKGVIAARTYKFEETVGKAAALTQHKEFNGQVEGAVELVSQEGIRNLTAFSTAPNSKWRVGIGIPRDALELAFMRKATLTGVGLLLLLGLGSVLALFMARRIASSVTGLTLPARDLIDGNPLRAPKVYFQEANEVSIAMADAAQKLGLRTTEAQIAFQNLQASEKSLTEANLTLESRVKERTQVLEELMQEREALGEAVQSQFDELKQANDLLKALRRRELEVGAIIQRSLVIEVPEGIEGAWLAQYADPSQIVDGDFCSIRRFGSNCFEVLVGDVMGKGIQAALMGTGIMTAYNRSLVDLLVANKNGQAIPSPADIVNAIHRSMTPQLMAISSFATLALYRFDLDAGTLTYVNAGHTHGLLTRGPGARPVAILGDNLPIGVMPEENYVELNLAVGPDDSLLIFSDGITEARNPQGEEFGLERLSDLIEAGSKANLLPTTIVQALRGAQRRFIGGGPGADDLTAVMVCLRPRRSGLVRSVEDRIAPLVFSLPWNLEGLGGLRDQIMACAGNLAQDDTDALILASFEAATNIIRHARLLVGDATITCRITRESDALAVEMVYPSESFTAPTQVNPDMSGESEGGFGLYIIEQSVDSVEYASPMPGVASVRVVKRAGVVQPAPTEPAI